MAAVPDHLAPLLPRIAEIAQATFPKEACGFICQHKMIVPCPNVASDPQADFAIEPAVWAATENVYGEITQVWHSHPNRRADASPADKTNSENIGTPHLIYAWPADAWDYYEPCGWIHELTGRPFRHGILDCYAVVRDYYRMVLGIELPNFERPECFWRKGLNIITDNIKAAGFVKVETPPQQHDVVVMRLNHGTPNHLGVYLGDGMMLHHPPGRPSCHSPYDPTGRGPYAKCTQFFARHASLMAEGAGDD